MAIINKEEIGKFRAALLAEDRAAGTVEKYLRDLRQFQAFLGEKELTKEQVLSWRDALLAEGLCPATVNSKLAALNRFFAFIGREDCRMKYLRIQRRLFRSQERELTREEYSRLIETAQRGGKERLALLMETICATGIRVSEVQYITVEAARQRQTEVALKGKVRTILLPGKLCRKLLQYAKQQKIASGEIFLTRSGRGLSRRQIWAEMKALCREAKVAASKVFPHNLRHLFARTFYRVCRDVVKLADVLGHSNVETTRIYLISTGEEHSRELERLGLVS